MVTINDLRNEIKLREEEIEEMDDKIEEYKDTDHSILLYVATAQEGEMKLDILNRILDFKERGIVNINSYTKLFNPSYIPEHILKRHKVTNPNDLKDKQLIRIFKDHIIEFKNYIKEKGNGGYIITIDDNHNINHNQLFYELNDLISKKYTVFKRFLLESKKVAIDPDMILIPFQVNKEFYYINIDNLSENLFLSDYEPGFRYINKQSNLYDIIQSVRKEELNNNLEYKGYLLAELRKHTSFNKKLINEIYDKPSTLLDKNQYLIKRFTEKYRLRNNIK